MISGLVLILEMGVGGILLVKMMQRGYVDWCELEETYKEYKKRKKLRKQA